ncbi:MAG: rubrerythrin family protein [Acidaminococcales bacterium]|jgi:rubrerythrin|nr:rubrerythrin family protein [Acidaminococcales bacterium]
MEKTMQGLAAAFAGESQANRKYTAYAAQADAQGYKQAAKLFRAAAEAETLHALAEFKALGKVKDTAENLKDAVAGETHEFKSMYPEFIEYAKEEKQPAAQRIFEQAAAAEKVHAELYQKVLDNLGKADSSDYYLCPICGYIHEGPYEGACPICGAKGSAFKKF